MEALATLNETGLFRVHAWPIQSIALAPNVNLTATGDTQRNLKVWREGVLVHDINLSSKHDKIRPTERIRGLAFSPTGDRLYVACGDSVRALDIANGQFVWSYEPPRSFGFLIISPASLAVSTEGDLAISTDAGRILVWTKEGALKAHWGDNDSPRQLAFLNGDRLIGTDSFSVCSWRTSTGRKLTRQRPKERIYGFSASKDGSRIALRSIHDVQVWDVASEVMLAQYPTYYGGPVVAMSADGDKVAFSSIADITVCKIGGAETRLDVSGASARSLAFEPDGASLFAGCSDGTVRNWEFEASA